MPQPERGRLWIALKQLTEAALPQVDYAAHYPGAIVKQNGQLFDFQPDSDKLPGIQGIGIYVGIPGVTFVVNTSENPRAVLFFENVSPAGAKLGLAGYNGLLSLSIGANGPAAARVGDKVTITLDDLLQFQWGVSGAVATPTGSIVPGSETSTISTGSSITTIA